MNSLSNYINSDVQHINYIHESLKNNTRIINENQLLLEHGKELDRIWYKVRCAINQEYNPYINESNYINTKFNAHESNIVRDLLVCFAENYKESLLEDSKICEALLNDDQTILEELEIAKQFKELAKQGKDKLTKLYNNIKTKIEALNEFIKDLFNKTIKDIKDVANKAIQLIEKVGESLFEIAQKIGFKPEQIEDISNDLIKDLKNNKEVITQTNVYESYAIELQKQINEGIVDKYNDVKDWFSKTKVGKFAKTPVGKMVLSLLNWGLVCVVLPGIVAAILPPGALFTIIFPCIVKFVWNIKKFKKIVAQTKDLIRRWKTLATWEKLLNAFLLLLNIAAFIYNLYSIGDNVLGQGIYKAFKEACESGELFSKLFTANGAAGIEPDSLTTFAAVWIKKLTGAEGSIEKIREKFLDGFKKQVEGGAEMISNLTDTATDAANNANISTEEATNKLKDIVDEYKGDKSPELWDSIWKLFGKPDVSKLDSHTIYRIVVDGTATDKAKWVIEFKNNLKNSGASEEIIKKAEDLLNTALNNANSNAGATTILELPGEIIQQNQNILGATQGAQTGAIFAVLGPVVKEAVKNPEIIKQFFTHMLFDVPLTDLYIPKGKGFIVRLGNESQKEHYEYKIEKDGLYLEKELDELKNEKGISSEDYKKIETEYKKLIDILTAENNKVLNQVLKSNKKSKEELKKEIEDKKTKYEQKLKEIKVTVLCGRRWKEEENKDKSVTDSYKSLHDYIINEKGADGIAIFDDAFKSGTDIIFKFITLICKAYNVTNIYDIDPNKLDGKLKDYYNEHIKLFIDGLKKFNKYLEDNNFKWVKKDNILYLDLGDKYEQRDKYIKQMFKYIPSGGDNTDILSDAFGCKSEEDLQKQFGLLKNTAEKVDDGSESIFTKLFNGDNLSEDETKQLSEYLKKKFTNLSDDDIKEIISKINELADKTKDEKLSESLLLESAYSKLSKKDKEKIKKAEIEINNLIQGIDKLINGIQNDDNILNQILKRTDNLDNDKINEIENNYKELLTTTKDKYLKFINKRRDKKDSEKLGLYRINSDQYDSVINGNFHNKLYKINKKYTDSFNSIFDIDKEEIQNKVKDIKNDSDKAKKLEILNNKRNEINAIFDEWEQYFKDNDIVDDIFYFNAKREWDLMIKEIIQNIDVEFENELNELQEKINNEFKKSKENIEKIKKEEINSISDEGSSDDLLAIYKKLIKAFSKDSKFKDDVKNNEYELLGDVSIEESYKSLYQYLLFEKLEKSDFRKNLAKLKDYLLKQVKSLTKKEKGEISKSGGEKHEIIPLEPNNIVKSMGATYEPEVVSTDDKNKTVITGGQLSPNEPIRQLPALVTSKDDQNNQTQDNSDKGKKGDSTDDKDTDDGKVHPVLLFVNCYGKDIAPYKGSKVREKFSMKGLMHSLFFKEYKKGMAIPDIKTMFGEILFNMVQQLQGMLALPPIVVKKNWWKDKKILNDKVAGDDERIDFGYLKNKDVVDILNNKKNAEKYVDLRSSITDILDSDADKKELKQKQKDYNKQLENPDEETIKLVKEIDPEGIDKDGKIINKDEIADTLASYSIAKYKSKKAKNSKGGFFSKIKNLVKNTLFGGSKDTGEKYVDLLNHLEKPKKESLNNLNDNLINENLKENNEFLNECFGRMSLSEYIYLKR